MLGEAAEIGACTGCVSGGEPLDAATGPGILDRPRPQRRPLYQPDRQRSDLTPDRPARSGCGSTACRSVPGRSAGTGRFHRRCTTAHARKPRPRGYAREIGFPATINVVLHRFNINRASEIITLAEHQHPPA